MGADPHAYLLTTALPKDVGEDWLMAFAQALGEDQKRFGGHLIGGDSIRTQGAITLSLTALGFAPKGQLMRRKARHAPTVAQPLSIYVSGTIGDSVLGLKLSQGQSWPELSKEDEAYLKQRHFSPEPRMAVSKAIRSFAKACIDISDGLVADVGHIAEQSNVQAIIHAQNVPLSPAARKLCQKYPDLLETLLTGGEDYELAFVVERSEESLLSIVSSKVNVPLTKIGALQPGAAGDVQVLDKESRVVPMKYTGWSHF
ncbi:MAG: thiamine-phosphate kinase [Proteobacteria bacterium]|nr:thiamine-phosphate kinase [Pseudomonadota bacterium]